jgi:hypothetical protein
MPKLDSQEQSERFVEIARALGADEDEAGFKAKLAVIARQKPKNAAQKASGPNAVQKRSHK